MKSINLKLSTSRKSLHRLSVRQRSRVMSEIRNNLRLLLSPKVAAAAAANNNKSNISSSFIVECSSSPECPSSVINDICNIRDNMHTESDESSFSSISDASDAASSFFNFTTQTEPSFRERLASCFVDNNLTHAQGNNILSLLRTHSCFYNLPKDVRTLLHTPRNCIAVSIVEPGEYIHFDLESSIIRCLMCVSSLSIVDQLEIDFNTDGCALDKSGSIHIWPIQYRIANIQHTKPIVAGIYKGTQKPYDPNKFFEKFIADIDRIMSNGGINLHGNKVPIRLRCFIADAPARAFILNGHRGHTSSQPCSKCKVSGTRSEARYVFNDVNHPLRTDEEYIRCVDGDHHKEDDLDPSMHALNIKPQSFVSFYSIQSLRCKNLFNEVKIFTVQLLIVIMYMVFFISLTIKPGLSLQQFFNRMAEIEIHGTNQNRDNDSSIHVSVQHVSNNYSRCRKIIFDGISLSVDMRDNCCLLHDGSVCIVFEIVKNNNSYLLEVKKFLHINDFYDIGILSSVLQVYKCSMLSNEVFRIHLQKVRAKCYRMPLWNPTYNEENDSDEENHSEASQYIVAAIIHNEKL
ncbi:uncharacterized protein [Polyergus mexicanus]|uniref:uncharacterized protein n=1 Tax=Polyergus mexicanus TaxID=615972 RepID=UPI0038B4AFF0